MFRRENRLVSGIRLNNSHIFASLQFVLKEKNNGLIINRFGIVVSKKIDKRAVERNRIKRFFRTALVSLNGKMNQGHDILLIVKKEIQGKTKKENLLILENALRKAGILRMND